MAKVVKRGAMFGLDWMLLSAGILLLSSAIVGTMFSDADANTFETTADLYVYDEKLPI